MGHAAKMCTLLELLNRRLQEGFEGTRPLEKKDLVNHLLQISRAIDHAVASGQRPVNSQRCLDIIKTITRLKDDDFLKPAMVVFLLAVKGTCRAGWFNAQEADELTSLYDQLLLHFQLDGNCSRQLTAAGSTQEENLDTITLIKTVCQRYCPRVKLGSVIVSFTTKKEYETRGCDFIVTQLVPPYNKLSLFVIQTENTETSACLVTPNSLSFILNGRGVERRSSLQNSPVGAPQELGPQMPTDVMNLLRLGNNFIQVVGESPGKYLVAVAATSISPYSSSTVELAEYVVPSTEADVIDDELVEAGSRISLRCPISHKRIITPVKGVLCKHHQCFDFDSYIEMNELRPVWRCPCCNSSVSCIQIRLDKKMKQILTDVDEKCFEAIINQDGTWIPAHSPDEQNDVGTARSTPVGSGAEWNQLNGVDVITSESGIIQLSDDDEMEPAVPAEKIMSPRVQPFSTGVSNNSEGLEDRKPNIRAASGGNIFQSAGLAVSSDRERPNTAAGSSPLEDASGHLAVPNNPSGFTPDSTGGIRYMQTPPATHLWSGGNVGMHASPFSTGQQIGSGVSSVDRNVYSSAGMSTSVPGWHPTFVQRSRALPQGVVAGTSTNGGFVTATSQLNSGHQLPVLVGSSQVFQHDIQQQQSQDLLQRNANSFRAPLDMSHRRGSRDGVGQVAVMNDQGFTRQGHIQQFGSATTNLTEQSSQTYSQFGQLSMSRQDWQSQRMAQLQQTVFSNANTRVGGGRSPTVSVGPSAMAPTAGVQQGPSPRSNSRVVNTGDANRMSTPPVVTSNNTIGPAASQALNWRPTGRMRGSVSGGYQAVNRTAVSSVSLQPGPVNRARPSAAPNSTLSMPVSNSVNLVSPLSTNMSPTLDTTTPDTLLSSGETLQDVIWLPTLGADQVDVGGTQVVDSWFSETPVENSSGGL